MPVSSERTAHRHLDSLADDLRSDILAGLAKQQKTLPCKYFYDERGSELFEQICELDEYYLTRSELEIVERFAEDIVAGWGPGARLIEYGSGSSLKTRLLLQARDDLAVYHPVDISETMLLDTADGLADEFPELPVEPVVADFTTAFEIRTEADYDSSVVYFPGSTIGNFAPSAAERILRQIGELVGPGGQLVIGVDCPKSRAILEAAYDDDEGVTAEFNLNLLRRIARELETDLDPEDFSHRAIFNADESRVEMHLVSERRQRIFIEGEEFFFERGETIHTENSYKYGREQFERISAAAGWATAEIWTDSDGLFRVQSLVWSGSEC